MKRDRFTVTKQTVTRYFVYGRGYNSSLDAHMQLAKVFLRRLCENSTCYEPWQTRHEARQRWWINRYPKVDGCGCFGCLKAVHKPEHFYGCTKARTEELRLIARRIMAGESTYLDDPFAKQLADANEKRDAEALAEVLE